MKPISIFFHGLFFGGEPPRPLPVACGIIYKQVGDMIDSGLWGAAKEIHFGINGGEESKPVSKTVIPPKAQITYHGLQNRNENLTIVMVHDFAKKHPGWNVLYAHAKGASHNPRSDYGKMAALWREGMMQDLVLNWRQCVSDLESHDVACSHFMRNKGSDQSQNISAGNFWWATSDFLATVPSIYLRDRIQKDGIGALSSRYEAEVWLSNGRIPNVKEYRPGGGGDVP